VFPSVASRTSTDDFIHSTTCSLSTEPPIYLECEPRATVTAAAVSLTPLPRVKLFIFLIFDTNAPFVSWEITNQQGEVVAHADVGTYTGTADAAEQIYLLVHQRYTFTISDAFADGMSGTNTGYTIVLAEYNLPVVLLKGDGNFEEGRSETLYVPLEGEQLTAAPSTSPSKDSGEQSCKDRNEKCEDHTECCSGRCSFGSCRSYDMNLISRTSLAREGRGGAAGRAGQIDTGQ
jgi:hypothetical protein